MFGMFLDRERLCNRRLFCYIKVSRNLMVWPGRMGNKMRKVAYLSILLLLLTMNGHVPFTKNTRFLSLDNLKRNTKV